MRRFDLLDEYTAIAAPRSATVRNRDLNHEDFERTMPANARREWRLDGPSAVGMIAIALHILR